jgi:hypothetical protein
MKAVPIIVAADGGRRVCPVPLATHVLLKFPGPSGLLCLPVYTQGKPKNGWLWNGGTDKPTLTPSICSKSGHYADGFKAEKEACWCLYFYQHKEKRPVFSCYICHSYVTSGMVQFLNDCTHEFKGQTLPMLEVEVE